jgi:hypothetical protein
MQDILNDPTKFRKLSDSDPYKRSRFCEDKINRILRELKNGGKINQGQFDSMYVSAAAPGTLYGTAKVHKLNTPLRPILAAFNMAAYPLAKFLTPFLDNICYNDYSLKNSYQFQESISKLQLNPGCHMVSFDVTSLYTQIPVEDAVNICADMLYENDAFLGLCKQQFCKLLSLTVKPSYFLFNSILYEQVDGLAMGSPAAPALANIFLNSLETKFLNDCPHEFRPLFYKRYLDDTFVIFQDPTHAPLFLQYINAQHTNIKFTMEPEADRQLAFLDVLVKKCDVGLDNLTTQHFTTSVYRKPTNSGQGTSFFSFSPLTYKINAIKTLLHRSYKLSSNYISLSDEITCLKNYFCSNGYPKFLVESHIKRFLNTLYERVETVLTVPRKNIYISFPYYGSNSLKLDKELKHLLSKFYPQINLKIAFNNPFKVSSFFPNSKERLPVQLKSKFIYKFQCGTCNSTYVGYSIRLAKTRFYEHLGRSSRTELPLGRPMYSAPREHSDNMDHPIHVNNFSIIAHGKTQEDLQILESLYIHTENPDLNKTTTSLPLLISSEG